MILSWYILRLQQFPPLNVFRNEKSISQMLKVGGLRAIELSLINQIIIRAKAPGLKRKVLKWNYVDAGDVETFFSVERHLNGRNIFKYFRY